MVMEIMSIEQQTLIEVRELLSDPARWTKGVSARDESGRTTNAGTKYAVCWCLLGAIHKCTYHLNEKIIVRNSICNQLYKRLDYPLQSLHHFNDDLNTKHSDVLNLLDRTIDTMD